MDNDFRSTARMRSLHSSPQGTQHALDNAFAILSNMHIRCHPLPLGICEMATGGRRHGRIIRDVAAHRQFLSSDQRRRHTLDYSGTSTAEGCRRPEKDSGKGHAHACARESLENRCCVCVGVGQADGTGVGVIDVVSVRDYGQ